MCSLLPTKVGGVVVYGNLEVWLSSCLVALLEKFWRISLYVTDDAIAKTSRVRISARTNRNEREFDPRFANAFRYIGGKFPICVKWLLRKWYLKIVWPDFNYLRFLLLHCAYFPWKGSVTRFLTFSSFLNRTHAPMPLINSLKQFCE